MNNKQPLLRDVNVTRYVTPLREGGSMPAKRPMKSQPKKEFPLRGILKSPCCGGNMTAGYK